MLETAAQCEFQTEPPPPLYWIAHLIRYLFLTCREESGLQRSGRRGNQVGADGRKSPCLKIPWQHTNKGEALVCFRLCDLMHKIEKRVKELHKNCAIPAECKLSFGGKVCLHLFFTIVL